MRSTSTWTTESSNLIFLPKFVELQNFDLLPKWSELPSNNSPFGNFIFVLAECPHLSLLTFCFCLLDLDADNLHVWCVRYPVYDGHFGRATEQRSLMTLWCFPWLVPAGEVLTSSLRWSHELNILGACLIMHYHSYTNFPWWGMRSFTLEDHFLLGTVIWACIFSTRCGNQSVELAHFLGNRDSHLY